MKSLVKYLFILAISVGFLAPTTALAKKAHRKDAQKSELPKKKVGAREPASHNGKKHKKKKKAVKPSAGEVKARKYFMANGN